MALTVIGMAGAGLRWQLDRMEAAALQAQRSANLNQIASLDWSLKSAEALGVDRDDIGSVQGRAAALRQDSERGQSRNTLLLTAARIESLVGQTRALSDAQRAENAALQQAAAGLVVRYRGNPEAMRRAGQTALAHGRDQATVAAFLKIETGRFNRALEKYGSLIPSPSPDQAALGVAGVQRNAQRISKALLEHSPSKLIVVSLRAQNLQALEHGRVVQETLVTTGRPNLATDVGRMQVVRKSSPWTMQSPWPKGSPYWYPDTPVRMVVWFTSTGEGMHDADWQPASTYGPGSQLGPYASHGCIHVPYAAEAFLYDWAPLGTPVVIYPGDGSPVVDQVVQQSVNDKGEPLSGQPSGV